MFWCPRCQTSLSDLEIEYKEEKGKLWYIKYPISNIQYPISNYITVATTRPETMLGDTAVAVNPKDERYIDLVRGRASIILPLVGRKIPIIADNLVDPTFGTGAVKVTPAHDLTDYEIGLKHNLESCQVIDTNGRITKEAPFSYQGLTVLQARKKVVEDLENKGFLEKIEDYIHQIPKCYRCATTIELIPSWQWFLKMKELAKMAALPVKQGKIKFHPKNFEKPYFDWLRNIKDWCISRQIWWGHKIPIEGESDVLDTWFSAALWPFATLGWPIKKGKRQKAKGKSDLEKFYPTDVLSTARDILNLWVARMIFSGMEFMRKIPFKDVYIHATVLTREGKRMSKSLGTGIDPINLVKEYGADATRFGIAWQIMGGQDIKFVKDNIVMGRKFCNKIWNASRFVLIQFPISNFQFPNNFKFLNSKLTVADRKILKALDKTIKSVNKDLENFRFGKAAHTLYDFFWHDFCDKYIEEFKSQKSIVNSQKVLLFVLLNSLKLLHPFMPFITEEIYQKMAIHPVKCRKAAISPKAKLFNRVKKKKECLMIEKWPQ